MFSLPDNVNIYNVKEIRQDLLEYLHEVDKECIIDAQNVKDIDGSGIQLLLSLYKSCNREDKSIKILHLDEQLNHILEISGSIDILHS